MSPPDLPGPGRAVPAMIADWPPARGAAGQVFQGVSRRSMPSRAAAMKGDGEAGGGSQGGGGAHSGSMGDDDNAASRPSGGRAAGWRSMRYGPGLPRTADAVVVGGGTVGAWCACFLRQAGLERVVLVEKGLLGQGASSRAAGVVRLQGGTPEAVRLGQWSRRFYLSQRDE